MAKMSKKQKETDYPRWLVFIDPKKLVMVQLWNKPMAFEQLLTDELTNSITYDMVISVILLVVFDIAIAIMFLNFWELQMITLLQRRLLKILYSLVKVAVCGNGIMYYHN